MKRFSIIIALLSIFLFSSCGELDLGNGNGNLTPEEVAAMTLAAAGDAYVASVQDANSELMALAFSGGVAGVSGMADWDGTISASANLDANYEIFFTNYQAIPGGVFLSGAMQVAVSDSGAGCSGTWTLTDLPVDDDQFNAYDVSTTGGGLTLSGSNCEIMNLSGQVNVSGDVNASGCSVSGTTLNPVVNCL